MHFRRIGLPLLLVLAAACAPGVPGTIVTVGVLVAVSPSSAVVPPGASQKFQAAVFGSSDTAVAWSVQESSGGSIRADGTYIAPAAAGSYHVVATSHADPTKSSAAPVSVTVPIVIALTPSSSALQTGASLKFQASVSGTTDTVVAWSVQEIGGGSIGGDGTLHRACDVRHVLPDSLYLSSKPAFFGANPWPWVDPVGTTKLFTLPAKARWDSGKPNP